jgi:hypothetical protein
VIISLAPQQNTHFVNMAIRAAWWMQQRSKTSSERISLPNNASNQPHWSTWPFHLPDSGLGFHIPEAFRDECKGDTCHVDQYIHRAPTTTETDAVWRLNQTVTSLLSLENALIEPVSNLPRPNSNVD